MLVTSGSLKRRMFNSNDIRKDFNLRCDKQLQEEFYCTAEIALNEVEQEISQQKEEK